MNHVTKTHTNMFKRPRTRVRLFPDLHPSVLDELETDLDAFGNLLPFTVAEWEIDGSSVRDDWQFHSDLDVNIVPENYEEARQAWTGQIEQTRTALQFLRTLIDKWGFRFDIRMDQTPVKDVLEKSCYRLRERVHYRPEKKVRVDIDPNTGEVTPRPVSPGQPKFGWSWFDEYSEQHINEEQYSQAEIDEAINMYGEKFLRIGDTPDTAYLVH